MALSTEQALALLLILNSAHLTAADCPPLDHVDVSGSVGGRAVMPCSYTPTPGQDVAVTWYAYQYQGECVLLIYNSKTPSAPIPAQWSGRVKLSDEVSSGNASLLISELTLEDTQDYTCIVGINRECVTHRAVKLTVQEPPKRDSTTSKTMTTTPTTRPSTSPTTRPSATPATRPSATPTTRPSATQKTSPCPTQQGNAAAQRRSFCMKPL
ncbi:T-cell immunoglobulin and mucin domain-containing protein 2-like [Acipenser ruthenus]|uniref:T-cell immunoglobulin and mucin domain-containing protein 2-like n=1 Tax=Acipenser ruthenus TaxID=7906 RepID=UPI0027429613|nr:T-cell immunoglobulin and mucin domain-containing protein 2-like [Acipenser ruthenus]